MDFVSKSEEHLGSTFEIRMPRGFDDVFTECFSRLHQIDLEYSRFRDDSKLSIINTHLGVWYDASDELLYLASKALEFNKLTEKNFDATLKSSLESLGYDKEYSFKVRPLKKDHILKKFFTPIVLDWKNHRIKFRSEIEFGGFGKGYCLDVISKILDEHNITEYYINGGGDIYSKGQWTILLEHPDDPEKAIGEIKLDGMAIACSAPNRRRWGKYHHLLNAKTRMPQDEVKCIFVIAKTGIEADAYATSIFAAGFVEGIRLSKNLPVEMLMVSKENQMYISEGFNAKIYV